MRRNTLWLRDEYYFYDSVPMAIKFVLVEIVLVETVLVGDPLYY